MTMVTLTAAKFVKLAGLLFQAQALQAQQHRQWLLLKQRNEEQFARQQAYYEQLEKGNGFSLIEVLVAAAILSICTVICIRYS